jgi:hypothetical protein
MTDTDVTNVTELRRPSPAKGEGPVRRSGKDPTGAIRAKRFRRNRKGRAVTVPVRPPPPLAVTVQAAANDTGRAEKRNDFKAGVTVDHGTHERRTGAVDIAALTAAVALATVAAWFSIRGMTVLFPGAPVAIVAMTVAMESAKLVTAGWLASRWRATTRTWRAVLTVLILGLAIINATGVYAQLVAAHVSDRAAATSHLEAQTADLDVKISVQTHNVADLDRRLSQIDSAVEEAAKRGRTNAALAAIEGQRRTRAGLVDERKREAAIWWPSRRNAPAWRPRAGRSRPRRRLSGMWRSSLARTPTANAPSGG